MATSEPPAAPTASPRTQTNSASTRISAENAPAAAPVAPRQPKSSAAPTASPRITRTSRAPAPEKLLIQEPPIELEDEDLQDTGPYVGCLAYFNGRIGLSFKLLMTEIDLKISGMRRPYVCQPGTFQPLVMSRTLFQAMRSILSIWGAWQTLIALESDPNSNDEEIAFARGRLNLVYDQFTDAYGYLRHCKHLLKFDGRKDKRLMLLPALEVEHEDETISKADCFFERTYFPPQEAFGQIYFDEEVSDRLIKAYSKVLNEHNRVEIDIIAEYTGLDMAEAEQMMVDLDMIAREPILPKGSGHRGILSDAEIVDL